MRSGRLVAHVVTSVGANAWLAFVSLFTMPYILLGLGRPAYGVFAMVSLVSSHLSNLELGFGHATIRFLARAAVAGDRRAAQAVLETSLAVFSAGGLTAGTIFLLGSAYLATSFFVIPTGLHREAVTAFRLGALILTCSFFSSFFSSALQALGRFAWFNVYRTVAGTTASVASVLAIMLGKGLPGVFLAQAAISLISVAILWSAVVRAHGAPLAIRTHRATLREMAGFGIFVFASGIAYQWMINGPPLVLSAKVDAAAIPAFAVPHVVLQRLAILISAVSLVFFPFASAESAGVDRSRLRAVFQSHLRLTAMVMGPIAAYLVVFGDTLLGVWVSREFARDAGPCMRLLSVAALVLAVASPAADVARAGGRPVWVLAYTVCVAAVAVASCFGLIPAYGPAGAALALLTGLIVGTVPLVITVASRLLDLGPLALLRRLLAPAVAVALLTAVYMVGRAASASFLSAVATGAVGTATYLAAAYSLLLDPREREALRRAAGPA
jgi:O-antigen/teichoic acid export membrane protein